MANMQSIVESDTSNINTSGSDIKPYPLNSSDISKQSKPKKINTEEQNKPKVDTSINLQLPKQAEQQNELSEQDKLDMQKQQQSELAQVNSNLNKPELTWDNAKDEQKIFFNVEKGGHTYYDYYINDGDQLKILRINSNDPKVIGRRVALSQAKSKDEADEIWFASYYDDKNTVYLPFPYSQNKALSFLKGGTNAASEWVEGVNRMAVDNARYFATKSIEKLFNELTDISKSPDYSYMLLQMPKTLATIAGMSQQEKQEFFSLALDRYTKSLEDQSKSYTKTSPEIERYKAELMKNIPDPAQYLQDLEDGVDYSDKKFKEFIESDETKKYLKPQEIKNSEAITRAFKQNPYIAEKMERIKIGSKKINKMYDDVREFIGVNYDPRYDSEIAYKAGGLSASYAATLMSIMTHGIAPAAVLFAGASYKETMDKAIERGIPTGTSLLAADINAAKEAITEQIQLKFFKATFSTINEMISKEMFNIVFENALQEGTQDFLQKGVEQIFGIDQFTMEDYVTDFIINAGVGAIMSVPMGAIVQYNKVKYIKSLRKAFPKMSEKHAIDLSEKIINMGTKIMASKAGSESFIDTLSSMLKMEVSENLKSKTGEKYDEAALNKMIDSTYKYLTSGMSLSEKEAFRKDFNDATEFTRKYLTETVGMFDEEAKELSKGLNKLYTSMQMFTGMSRRQIAEKFLPNTVNMMALSAIGGYKYADNKNDFIKFESGILKTVFKTLGPTQHLTDVDFINMAKDVMNNMPMEEVANKYKVLYNKERYDLVRNTVLVNKINFPALSIMLENSGIKNKELTNSLNDLVATNPSNRQEYNIKANNFYNLLNKVLGNKSIAGALFANNKEISNPVKAFNTLFINKPIAGVDIHEVGHFFDIVFYANQMCAKLGLPTTSFNIKIINLYNALGRKITGKSDFVYNPYNYTDPDQVKVAEALPNIMADYFKNGIEYSKESTELVKYISSLYKYINSNTSVTSEYADTEEGKKLVQEILKGEEEDELSIALDKLFKLADTGDFSNQDIYNIVNGLKLNEALKLAIYIEKGQHPVVTLIQAINDINNTRVDSMYRKAIDFNEDLIPSKYMTIPEGDLFEEDFEYGIIQQAKKEWESSDKSLQASRDIYKKYGVYKDEQGSWGYIISDKDMSINRETFKYIKDNLDKLNEFDSKLKLGELIDHKQLFNIDPFLKSLRLVINSSMEKNNPAALDISTSRPIININADIFKNDSYYELRTALAHEIQHAIDKSAKLKLGGDMLGSIANFIKDDSRFKDVLDFINKGKELKKKNKAGNIDDKEKNTFQDMLSIAEKAFNIYQSDIGEVRARSTENDINKSIEELFDELPPTERRDVKNVVVSNDTNQLVNSLNGVFDNAKEKVLKDFDRHLPENEQNEAFNLNMTVEEIMSNNLSKTFAVVSEVLKKNSPKLFAHSRRAMYKAMQDMVYYKHQLTELEKSIRKMSNDDLYVWEKACLNRDIDTMYSLAGRYNFAPELVGMMKSLRELHQIVCSSFEGEQYNQLLGFLQNYWPRLVINHDGLASALAQKDRKFDSSNDTPETHNNKADKWMDEVQEWIENDLFYKKEKQGSPYFYKERKIEYVDEDLMPFYAKSTDALDNYLNKVQDILFRKYFFGSDYVKAIMNSGPKGKHINMNGIDYVIPNWKQRVKEMGFLTDDPKVNKQILDAIESVFFRGDTSSWNAIYRTATNIMTINSFFSALSNLGDLALTLYNYGFKNTMSAIKDVAVKDAPITSQDLGIVDLYEEFKSDGTKLKKIFNWTMKWSGFQYLDMFTKEVNIQASLLNAKENLQKGGDAEAQLIDKCYMYMGGDEEAANALISNILNNNWKDPDVKLFAFNELSNQQPITKLEVPEFYNRYPQFRALYLYKTFAVKQLNFAYTNIISEIKKNPKEGFKKLIRFMAWLLAVGVTKDVIADMLKGKEINLTDSAMFSITSFFFLNEYNYYTFKNKGAAIGVFHLVMPPIPLLAEISSDVKKIYNGKLKNPMGMQVVKGVPVIGKPFYYWFGN